MNKYKGHTPEPWEVRKDKEPYTIVIMPKGKLSDAEATPYASIGGFSPRDRHIMEANAQLIADAPKLARQNDKMLNFLKEWVDIHDTPGSTNWDVMHKQMKYLLAWADNE